MAGFVDGEGMLTIVKQKRKHRPSPAFRAEISIVNTQRVALLPFQEEYGGEIQQYSETRRGSWKSEWSDAYAWLCPHSCAERFLTDLLPYLRLKSRNARIILRFLNKRNPHARKRRRGRGGSAPLSDEEIALRERLRHAIRILNRKARM